MERVHDYAIIGDCRSAALVSRSGSIDWLCWPYFDSPSLFGALLDERAGRWRIAPVGAFDVAREYVSGTNVLRTRYRTSTGAVLLTDLMPVASEEEKRSRMVPDHEILRVAECESGDVELEMLLDARPDYARRAPRLRDTGALGVRIETSTGLLTLHTDAPRRVTGNLVRARERLRAGQARHYSLTFHADWMAVTPPVGAFSRAAIERSIVWWRRWSSSLRYDGPARDAVVRSALVLKLLVYAPSGAVIAAPTTSLPERVGGDLNWDYRYCWLRDASLTVRALFGLGFDAEAEAFVSWLLHSTLLTRPELRVLYDLQGNAPKQERTLAHLSGHRGSRPVRVGNAAADQLQLDVYGEVIAATAHLLREGRRMDRETQGMLRAFGSYVCRNWQRPDEGIWEPRSGRRCHTHSRLLCWAALDRLIWMIKRGHLRRAPIEDFSRNRDLIRREIETRAWNERIHSYVSELDGDDLDASLLLIPRFGFESAASERMRSTLGRIRERLGAGDGLLYRYRTGESPGEGAFGVCGFWGAEALALGGGSVEEAEAIFEHLCRHANDVGLFAEEIDPASGDAVGNFPQAFTHVGLINAALTLERRLAAEEPRARATAWQEVAAVEARS